MNKIISILLILSLIFSCITLCSCGATKQCEYDSMISALRDIKNAVPDETEENEDSESDSENETESINNVTACIYGSSDEYYDVKVLDDFISLFEGEYTESGNFDGKKVLSVTISMQYEITFFDSGDAMIYYGFCNVFQSDRQYYKVKLNNSVEALREYILNNGTKLNMEDK